MLRLEGLEMGAGDFRLRADWELAAGARLALIGPSGAGKSTLLATLAGLAEPLAGRVLWKGRDLNGVAPGARPLSILFQDHNLFPHMSAAENVGLGLRPDLRLSRRQRAAVAAVLERVGLAGMGERLPAALSGGQQQRLALARVLLRARPLLLLDEPFAALGPALKAEMLDLVAEIAGETGLTLLLVTHEPRDAERLADLVSLVAGGRAAAPRGCRALFDDPPPALRAYLGAGRGNLAP